MFLLILIHTQLYIPEYIFKFFLYGMCMLTWSVVLIGRWKKFLINIFLTPNVCNIFYNNWLVFIKLYWALSIVWTFFGSAFLWDWNENWPFPVLWPLLNFPNMLAYWVQHFIASSFGIWNSSNGIPSPPLVLFTVMLPTAHLTSHSRMSDSRWVITPSWLSES